MGAEAVAAIAGLGAGSLSWQYRYLLLRSRHSGPERGVTGVALAIAIAVAFAAALAIRAYAPLPAILTAMFAGILILAAGIDLERHVIPNRLVYPAIVAAIVAAPAWPDRSLAAIVAGAVVATAIAASFATAGRVASFVFRKPVTGLGAGDIKLVVLIGLVVGWPGLIVALLATAAATFAWIVAVVIRGRGADIFPLGPSLAVGGLAAMAWLLVT